MALEPGLGGAPEAHDDQHAFVRWVEAVFGRSPLIVTFAAPDGELAYANEAAAHVSGIPVAELTLASITAMFHPDSAEAIREGQRRRRSGEVEMVRGERHYVRPYGSDFWLDSTSTVIRNTAGEVLGWLAVSVDITARRRAEVAAEVARGQAEAASRAKSDFLSRTSHELRTPLTAILGFGELLLHEDLDPRQGDYVNAILHAGQHLLDLLNEVLDISAVESGKLALSMEAVSTAVLVESVMELLRPLAASRRITITHVLPDGEVFVRADAQRLKQVLLNLGSNALKYNREGGTVEISVTATPDTCRVSVSDTGPGIVSGDLGKLFHPFERLDAARQGIDGTGLGLALARNLVTAMGGTLDVSSEPGSGSVFWVQLPVAESQATVVTVGELAGMGAVHSYDAPRRVLYAEDTAANVHLVSEILGHRPGLTVLSASQGRAALEIARQSRPDLILLDLHLPELDGEALLARLRADPATAGIPVVILSADATPETLARLRAAGAADYLTKPVGVKRLLETVDRFLGGVAAPGRPV